MAKQTLTEAQRNIVVERLAALKAGQNWGGLDSVKAIAEMAVEHGLDDNKKIAFAKEIAIFVNPSAFAQYLAALPAADSCHRPRISSASLSALDDWA